MYNSSPHQPWKRGAEGQTVTLWKGHVVPPSRHLLPPAHGNALKTQRSREANKLFRHGLAAEGILGKLKTAWILVEFSLFPCRREQDKFRRPYGNLWTAAGNTCVWAVVKCWKAKHENWNHAGPNKEKLLSLNHTPGCLVFMGCYSHLVYWYRFTHDEDFRSAIKALSST